MTSVEGHKLPGGADVEDQLRDEILGAKTVIGLISSVSFNSAYVLFELGARWGIQRNLIPLLAHGTSPSILKGPISGYNALMCDNNSQLLQLIRDVSRHIDEEPESPHVYQKNIERILQLAARTTAVEFSNLSSNVSPSSQEYDFKEADDLIHKSCKDKWPEDYQMQVYCEEQQRSALEELKRGCPQDIPMEVFERIRAKCSAEWSDDFEMRHHCESEQFKAYRKLRS